MGNKQSNRYTGSSSLLISKPIKRIKKLREYLCKQDITIVTPKNKLIAVRKKVSKILGENKSNDPFYIIHSQRILFDWDFDTEIGRDGFVKQIDNFLLSYCDVYKV